MGGDVLGLTMKARRHRNAHAFGTAHRLAAETEREHAMYDVRAVHSFGNLLLVRLGQRHADTPDIAVKRPKIQRRHDVKAVFAFP